MASRKGKKRVKTKQVSTALSVPSSPSLVLPTSIPEASVNRLVLVTQVIQDELEQLAPKKPKNDATMASRKGKKRVKTKQVRTALSIPSSPSLVLPTSIPEASVDRLVLGTQVIQDELEQLAPKKPKNDATICNDINYHTNHQKPKNDATICNDINYHTNHHVLMDKSVPTLTSVLETLPSNITNAMEVLGSNKEMMTNHIQNADDDDIDDHTNHHIAMDNAVPLSIVENAIKGTLPQLPMADLPMADKTSKLPCQMTSIATPKEKKKVNIAASPILLGSSVISHVSSPECKVITKDKSNNNTQRNKRNKRLPQSQKSILVSPSKLSSPTSTVTNKRLFLDDPTKAAPLTVDDTHLINLDNNNKYLCTGLIDYLIQRSVPINMDQRTIVASSLSLSLMQAYLTKEYEDNSTNDARRGQRYLRSIYQYYTFGEFQFYSLVCTEGHFFVVSCKFEINDANKQIFKDVHIHDSLKLATRGRTTKTLKSLPSSPSSRYLMTLQKFLSTGKGNGKPELRECYNRPSNKLFW
jgi:hypothetical protein